MIKEYFSLMGTGRKRRMLLLLPAMLIASVLEMLGIGLIVAVCSVLIDDEWLYSDARVAFVCRVLHIRPGGGFIIAILLLLVALYLAKMLYLAWENYVVAKFVRTVRSDISVELLRRITRAEYPFFVRHSSSELQNLLGQDMYQFASGLNACMQLMLEGLVALGMGAFLLYVDPLMTAFVMAGIVILLLLIQLPLDRVMQKAAGNLRQANSERWKWFHQVFVGIKDVKIGQHEDFVNQRFAAASRKYARAEYINQLWSRIPSLVIETVMIVCVLIYLIYLVAAGEELLRYLPGLSALALTAVRLLPTCNRISSSLTQLGYSKASVGAVKAILEETNTAIRAEKQPQREVAFTKGLSLHHVSYAYEGKPEAVLTDVDMEIPAGTSVGIIGPSGAGKTTLLDILLGLLIPSQGSVEIDGVPIEQCNESFLNKTAYVPQSTFLMNDTVRSNVAMGVDAERIDDKLVWDALEKAALSDTIRALPDGLDTQVGERGVRFSGGECQRLGLARALYQDPTIIFFDEATSALDLETEAAVLRSIEGLRDGRTLIIVSHRSSAISNCDLVYRVQDGRVIRER